MPSPMDTLLRTQLSPAPAQTFLEFVGSMARAPIERAGAESKTGLKVRAPFTDFQTPPLAEPTKRVRRPLSFAAVTAEMRPLIVAEPMLRAGRPETVPES